METPSTVWRLTTHHLNPECHLDRSRREGRIAVGWNGVDDLIGFSSEAEMSQAVRRTGNRNWPSSGRQLMAFRSAMKHGDLVILSTGRRRSLVMRVDGPYEFGGKELDDDVAYAHRRSATVVPLNPDELWREAGGPADGQSVRWTLVGCRYEVTEDGKRAV